MPSLLHVLQKNATGSVATIAISIVAINIASVDTAIDVDIASIDIGMLPLMLNPPPPSLAGVVAQSMG